MDLGAGIQLLHNGSVKERLVSVKVNELLVGGLGKWNLFLQTFHRYWPPWFGPFVALVLCRKGHPQDAVPEAVTISQHRDSHKIVIRARTEIGLFFRESLVESSYHQRTHVRLTFISQWFQRFHDESLPSCPSDNHTKLHFLESHRTRGWWRWNGLKLPGSGKPNLDLGFWSDQLLMVPSCFLGSYYSILYVVYSMGRMLSKYRARYIETNSTFLAANLPTSGNCGGRCVCAVVVNRNSLFESFTKNKLTWSIANKWKWPQTPKTGAKHFFV